MAIRVEITESEITAEPLAAEVAASENGATVVFLGTTRDHHEGREVEGLDYECYREMAQSELEKLADAIALEFDLQHLVVVHRLGKVDIGEVSIGVAAASAHRKVCFDSVLELIDRLKRDVPIWKREHFVDGTVGWVEGAEIKDAE